MQVSESARLTNLLMRGKVKAGKNIFKYDQQVLAEDDETRKKRLTDLFDIYKRHPTDELLTFIQTLASTYSKLFVTELDVQNKVSKEFLDFLTKTLLMLAMMKRDFNTLQSLIKQTPENPAYIEDFYVNYLLDTTNCDFGTPAHHDIVATLYVYTLLVKILKDDIKSAIMVHLLGSLIMKSNENIRKHFTRAFKSGRELSDCAIITENYYNVAKKFHEINLSKNCTLKLLSMGLTNDLTRLDNLRFNLDIHKDRTYDIETLFQRMSQVLVFMSKIVESKYLKLKCLAAARTVADEKLASFLEPVIYTEHYDSIPIDDQTEDDLMNLLEFFTSAICKKISFHQYYKNNQFISSFDGLVHMNAMNGQFDDSKMEYFDKYPVIERILKRAHEDDENDVGNDDEDYVDEGKVKEENKPKVVLDTQEIKRQTDVFNSSVSQEFRNIFKNYTNGFESFDSEIQLDELESPGQNNGYPAELEIVKKPFKIVYDAMPDEKTDDNDDTCDCLKISTFCDRRYNINEMETGMFYFILSKKCIYSPEDFHALNQNPRFIFKVSNRTHSAIQYLMFRPIPGYSRMQRIKYIFFTPPSLIAALLEHYIFEPQPSELYGYKTRSLILKPRRSTQVGAKEIKPQGSPESTSTPVKASQTPSKPTQDVARGLPRNKIPNEEHFLASDDLLEVFLEIERQLNEISTANIKMDASQAMNENSAHSIGFIAKNRPCSSLPIVVKTKRNQKIAFKEELMIKLPCVATGNFDLLLQLDDKIVYDESNLPQIETTDLPSITGYIKIYGVTHHIKKLTIPFVGENKTGKLSSKLSFAFFTKVKSDTKRRVSTTQQVEETKSQQEVKIKQEPEEFVVERVMNVNTPMIFDDCYVKLEPLETMRDTVRPVESTNVSQAPVEQMNIEPDICVKYETESFDDYNMYAMHCSQNQSLDISQNYNGSFNTSDAVYTTSHEDVSTISATSPINPKVENIVKEEFKNQPSPGATYNDFEEFLTSHTISVPAPVKIEEPVTVTIKPKTPPAPSPEPEPEPEQPELSPWEEFADEMIELQPLFNQENRFSIEKTGVPFENLSIGEQFVATDNCIATVVHEIKLFAQPIVIDFKEPCLKKLKPLPSNKKYAQDGFVNSNNHLSHLSLDCLANLELFDEIDLSTGQLTTSSPTPEIPQQQRSQSNSFAEELGAETEEVLCVVAVDPLRETKVNNSMVVGEVIVIDDDD